MLPLFKVLRIGSLKIINSQVSQQKWEALKTMPLLSDKPNRTSEKARQNGQLCSRREVHFHTQLDVQQKRTKLGVSAHTMWNSSTITSEWQSDQGGHIVADNGKKEKKNRFSNKTTFPWKTMYNACQRGRCCDWRAAPEPRLRRVGGVWIKTRQHSNGPYDRTLFGDHCAGACGEIRPCRWTH